MVLLFASVLVIGALLIRWVETVPATRFLERSLARWVDGIGRLEREFWERF